MNDEVKTSEEKIGTRLFRVLEILRFSLPLLADLTFLAAGAAYAVRGAMLGKRYMFSVIRLFINTFKGTYSYLAGAKTSADNAFFAVLATGAAVGVLALVASLFFSVFALFAAVRILCFPQKDNRRVTFLFHVLFPNRVWLFLSGALVLLPALFPEYYSLVASRLALDSGQAAFYVIYNIPLYLVGGLLLLFAGLSVYLRRIEKGERDLFKLQ